ncbi:Hypothetical protein R9X50_00331400 [Acrodontium crateriforme]|uniref:RRM domain-containing protein n=1 Tax=Acrodontium crateriforme TaxID=150365 RepID=A0AAQ3M434_9PEZI|nr:Hypothetical protein R9X50_00331400 [Acrodontium crateriforme]
MDHSQYGNPQYSNNNQYNYPPGYTVPYAQQQQYQQTPPQIRNPFAPPPTGRSNYPGQNASYDPEHEAEIAQWQSAYTPQEQQDKLKKGGRPGETPNLAHVGAKATVSRPPTDGIDAPAKPTEGEKQKTVVRKGGGQTWEDKTLLEWDPTQFRIMVGNLAGEVTDESLAKAFAAYGVSKARVIRDKLTTKSRGFGFVSFTDGEQGFKAAREMVGKYIGSHPVTIQRSKADIRPVVQKDRHKGKNNHRNNKNKNKKEDPLRASTGAHVDKKSIKNPAGMKVLG